MFDIRGHRHLDCAHDPRHRLEYFETLWRLHSERRTTVILVTHEIGLAAHLASRILLLQGGRTVADGSREAVLTAENLTRAFGVAFAGRLRRVC